MRTTTIFNDTGFPIAVKKGIAGVYRDLCVIPIGGRCLLSYDENETYIEYEIVDDVHRRPPLYITPEDITDFSEIRVSLEGGTTSELAFRFDGNARRGHLDIHDFNSAKGKVSLKIHAALGSYTDLKKLLGKVRICCNQCKYLVQIYEDHIQKMKNLYSELATDTFWMTRFYNGGRLTRLGSALDSLEYIVCDVKDLLGACAKEVERIALVVSSMPMPPDDRKEMEVSSKFDLLVRELMWNFDLIEYELQRKGDMKLEWCLTQRRYVLNRMDGSKNSVAEVESAKMIADTVGGVRSLARMDRENLWSGESASITTHPTFSWYEQLKQRFGFGRPQKELDILHDIIVKRCKVEMPINQNPSGDVRSLSVNLECFRIDHLDLQINTRRVLGSGTFKNTYGGVWCGQRVAISTLKFFDIEEVENEVKQLIGLQHPKVVSFYGWAYTEDAPPPIKEVEENLKCQGYYIVTEKMECDLEDLINRTRRAATIQRDSGGPFSLSVGLDILLQIVEAMLHVHKHGVMHRDLKPKNFLVNSRRSPRAEKFYDVKLIDFGASKLFVEDINTHNRGTTRYGAPEMMTGGGSEGDNHGKYGQSVDVFSFAMTCYQVMTGVEPFRNTAVRKEIVAGKRPPIPTTILSSLKELMEACWAKDPDIRPTFEEIQERLWTIKMQLAVPIAY